MSDLHLDFESGSTVDLRKTGVFRYAEDAETRIWLFSYRFGDGPVLRWRPGDAEPREVLDHVARGGRVVAHNAQFERVVWNSRLRADHSQWPRLAIAQMDDTMARALAVHLPADLDTLGKVLGLAEQKDDKGSRLMMKMARPRKIYGPQARVDAPEEQVTRRANGETVLWWNTPENLARLGDYCDQDVRTECAVDAKLPPLSPDERELWERDQAINDRGVALDVATIERAVSVREVALRRADARMAALTGGAVRKCSESGRLVAWLAARGLPCDSVAKDGHDELRATAQVLGDDEALAVIDLRAQSTKTSAAKFERMLGMVCADGRARGLFNYHRALTGRWGGAQIQPQNLPRVDEKKELPQVLAAIDAMETFA